MATRIRLEYRRAGRPVTVYEELLVLDRPDTKVLLLESHAGADLRVKDQVILGAGAPIVWYMFPEKWHNIGRFHLADGTFTGWYTNFIKPVEIQGDNWSATDLFLDLWQPAKGDPVWLDEDEFNAAHKAGKLDNSTRQRVLNERALIELQVKMGGWPPPITRDIDLQQARSLIGG